jgi:hypothetical protein
MEDHDFQDYLTDGYHWGQEGSIPDQTEEGAACASSEAAVVNLLAAGFQPSEVRLLLQLRARVRAVGEIPPYMSGDPHMQFARWLYEHGALNEFFEEERS